VKPIRLLTLTALGLLTAVASGNAQTEERQPERRRETLRYRPAAGVELRYACEMNGRAEIRFMGNKELTGSADLRQKVARVDENGLVHVATHIENGITAIGDEKEYETKDTILVAQFDSFHQMHRVDRIRSEEDKEDDEEENDDRLDLGTILLYLTTSVAYRDRSIGEGSKWDAEYRVIDTHGQEIPMAEHNEFVTFLYDGPRRIAVIKSLFEIPIRGRAGSIRLKGSLECDVISEVYVDTGGMRYRSAMCNGKLKPDGGVLPLKAEIKNLNAVLGICGPDGVAVEPLYNPDDDAA